MLIIWFCILFFIFTVCRFWFLAKYETIQTVPVIEIVNLQPKRMTQHTVWHWFYINMTKIVLDSFHFKNPLTSTYVVWQMYAECLITVYCNYRRICTWILTQKMSSLSLHALVKHSRQSADSYLGLEELV